MAKTKISEFSATANSNTDINSINIAEGCAPSNINDAIRELMAELKDFQAGTKGDSFNGPVGTSTAAAGAFTTLSSTGNTTLGDASGDTVTINGTTTFVNVNPTLSAGTANGVLYLNGSKVATSGSALTFDGTNLGIGTSSPAYKLDVAGIGRLTTAVNSNATSLILNNSNSAAGGVGVSIDGYSGNTSNKLAQIIFGGAGATGGNIDFLTSANGSSYVDRMRLDSSGNLGIGTSSPNQKLEVSGNIQVTATNKVIFNDGGGTDCFIGRSGAQTLVLGTASAERMRLDSSGNVGIGTSTPSTKLDIQGGAQANTGILLRLSSQSSGVASKTQYTDGNTYNLTFGSNGTGNFVWSTGEYATTLGTERMRLDSSGNLGLGVTPSAWASIPKALQISRLAFSGDTDSGAISHNAYYNAGWKYIASGASATQYDQYAGMHRWFNAPSGTAGNAITFSQAMTLDASGNLQIGRTSVIGTNNRLAIQMSGTSASGYTAATNAAFAIDAGTATNSVINLVGGGDLGIYRSNSSNAYDVGISFGDNSTRSLSFTTANTERARIDSSGNLGIGTTSPSATVHANASGGGSVRASRSSVSGEYIQLDHDGTNGTLRVSGANNLIFNTNSAERARIDSSGNLLLGVTAQLNSEKQYIYQSANGIGLQINCVNATQTDYCFRIRAARNTTNGTFNAIAYYNDGAGAYKFNVADSGNVTNTNNSYGAISDIKLKENITDATPKLADLMQVKVRNYNLKTDPEHKQLGVIAQELEQVFPGMVEESPDRDAEGNDLGTTTKQVKYSVFVPMLIKAMQEQQNIIEQLKADVAALKGA